MRVRAQAAKVEETAPRGPKSVCRRGVEAVEQQETPPVMIDAAIFCGCVLAWRRCRLHDGV